MTVVGEAVVSITAKTENFASSLEKGLAPGLSKMEKDAESAGTRGGGKMAHGLSGALSSTANLLGVGFLTPLTDGIDKFGEHADKAGGKSKGFSSQLQSIGGGVALGVAAAVGAVGVEAVNMAGKFDASTGAMAASAGISVEAAKKIGAAFLTTGGQTTFSAQEMTTAYATVAGQLGATAGHALNAKESLTFMKAAMDAAEATGGTLSSTTATLGKVMQAFGINVKGASGAADVLTQVSFSTGIGMDTLAAMLSKLHTQLGVNAPSLAQSATLLEDFAKHGVTGRGAITAMSGALTGMVNPTAKQQAALASMNISLTDSHGKFIGIGPALELFKGHMGANASASDKAALATIFHGKTLAQLTPIIMEGGAGFDKMAASVTKTGSAHAAAEKASANLHDQMKKLESAVKDQITQWGEKLMPVLEKIIGVFVKLGSFILNHKIILIALAAVIGTVLVAAFVAWAAAAATAAIATIAATWPILLIIAAVGLVVAAIIYFAKRWHQIWDEVKAVVMDVVKWIIGAWNAMVEWFKALPGRLLDGLKGFGKLLLGWITTAWTGLTGAVTAGFLALVGFFMALPGRILTAIATFGALILGWITDAWNAVVSFVTTGFTTAIAFWGALPGQILTAVEKFGEMILKWITDAWTAVVGWITTAFTTAIAFWAALPGQILAAIATFGALVLGWITDAWNAVVGFVTTAFTTAIAFWGTLPGQIIGAITGFIELLGGWMSSAWTALSGAITTGWNATVAFFTGMPAAILGALGNAATVLYSWGTGLISGIVNGIGAAAGAIGSALSGVVTGAIGSAKSALESIPIIGGAFRAVFGAEGGFVNGPTLAVIGEAGPELVLPLNKPNRMMELIKNGGVPMGEPSMRAGNVMGARMGGSGHTVTMNNHFTVSADLTNDTLVQLEQMVHRNNVDLVRRLSTL